MFSFILNFIKQIFSTVFLILFIIAIYIGYKTGLLQQLVEWGETKKEEIKMQKESLKDSRITYQY